MHGIILAAGGGTRLRPLTDELPKTLLPVDGACSILELAVSNLAQAGVGGITVVTGHAADRVDAVAPLLAARHHVDVDLHYVHRYATFNNAYSLWAIRHRFADGVLLVNGDTVHPPVVEERLLAAPTVGGITLALDDCKELGDEEMKVESTNGRVSRITKAMDPARADGEYIGVARIEPEAGMALAAALRTTWESDPGHYYEDGFQLFADWGHALVGLPITPADWVEVDDHADLARARQVTARWRAAAEVEPAPGRRGDGRLDHDHS